MAQGAIARRVTGQLSLLASEKAARRIGGNDDHPLTFLVLTRSSIKGIVDENNKRVDYRGQNLVQLLGAVLLNPFVIIFSLLVDLVSLPALLLKDEKNFEFKY